MVTRTHYTGVHRIRHVTRFKMELLPLAQLSSAQKAESANQVQIPASSAALTFTLMLWERHESLLSQLWVK